MILRCAAWCASSSSSLFSLARGNTNIVDTKLPEALMKFSAVTNTPLYAEDKPSTYLFPLSPNTNLLTGYGRNPSFINNINVV
jgi:hypothetical protein